MTSVTPNNAKVPSRWQVVPLGQNVQAPVAETKGERVSLFDLRTTTTKNR